MRTAIIILPRPIGPRFSIIFGLFSVPAPPFRSYEQDGGVFSFSPWKILMSAPRWSIHGSLAMLESAIGVAKFDLANPSAGLTLRHDDFLVAPLFASEEAIDQFVLPD